MEYDLTSRIYKISSRIPKGKVATYGQIAFLAGNPRAARAVGWALRRLPENSPIPWHRIINGQGRSSFQSEDKRKLQFALLQAEGVGFNSDGVIDLNRYLWNGR